MNKTAIKNFAIWARNKLIADVSYDARLIGITEDGIAKPLQYRCNAVAIRIHARADTYTREGRYVRSRRPPCQEAL